MLACYLTVLNLGDYINTQLQNIHLVSLCHYADVKELGYKPFLEPIVADLKILESDGIDIIHNNTLYNIKGSIFSLSHDNLSANSLYGSNKSFRSHFFCRFCKMHLKDTQNMFHENIDLIRNREDYNL